MKHYYLIIVSHNDSEPDEIKIELSLEGLWGYFNGLPSALRREKSLWSIVQLSPQQQHQSPSNSKPLKVTLFTPWSDIKESEDSDSDQRSKTLRTTDLSNVLNNLSDEFDTMNSYTVDVVWITPSLCSLPNFRDDIKLYGVMKRLSEWHKARLSFCNCDELIYDPMFTWGQVIPLQIFRYPITWDEVLQQNVLWRGGLVLKKSMERRRVLRGFQVLSMKPEDKCLKNYDENFCVVDEIPINRVPPYMISNSKFELALPIAFKDSNTLLKESWKFLSNANSTLDVGIILRVRIRDPLEAIDNRNSTYEFWKRFCLQDNGKENNIKPEKSSSSQFQLFILLGDGLSSPYSASLYSLRTFSDFNFNAVHQMNLAERFSPCFCSRDGFLPQLPKSLPQFSEDDVKQLESALSEWQTWLLARWNVGEKDPKFFFEIFVACGKHIVEKFKKSRFGIRERRTEEAPDREEYCLANEHFSMDEDEREWPERLFLKKLSEKMNKPKIKTKFGTMDYLSMQSKSAVISSKISMGEIITRVKPQLKNKPKCRTRLNWTTTEKPTSKNKHHLHNVFYNESRECEVQSEKHTATINRFSNIETMSSLVDNNLGLSFTKNCTDKENNKKNNNINKPGSASNNREFGRNIILEDNRSKRRDSRCHKIRIRQSSSQNVMNERHKQKLRIAVVDALDSNGIKHENELFKVCAKKLFEICKTFAKDVIGLGRTSQQFENLAMSHVQQVVNFHKKLMRMTSRVA